MDVSSAVAQVGAPAMLPRNILTKDRAYTISLFKE